MGVACSCTVVEVSTVCTVREFGLVVGRSVTAGVTCSCNVDEV